MAPPRDLPKPSSLRRWQSAALEEWRKSNFRGIVAAATGTGKTTLALAAIADFWSPNSRVAIVVPNIALQRQWLNALKEGFGLDHNQIGTLGGGQSVLREAQGFVVAVINSARDGLPALTKGWCSEGRPVLLVIDECHWAAAKANSQIFNGSFDATLGLSATPERSDDGYEEVLVPHLGEVVYRYTLREALDDELLAPLTVWNLLFELTAKEHANLLPIQSAIDRIEASLASKFPDLINVWGISRVAEMMRLSSDVEEATSLRSLYASRSALLERSDGRRSLLHEIGSSDLLRSTRSLVFHERIEEARKTAALLEGCGHRTSLELSTDDQRRRVEAIRDFKSGAAQVLVAVKTLDEGIDLPDAKLAVIAAGSSSPRQRIQRIGRVIRPTGAPALVISLTAKGTSEEFVVAANDGILVGSKRVKLLNSLQDGLEQWNR